MFNVIGLISIDTDAKKCVYFFPAIKYRCDDITQSTTEHEHEHVAQLLSIACIISIKAFPRIRFCSRRGRFLFSANRID